MKAICAFTVDSKLINEAGDRWLRLIIFGVFFLCSLDAVTRNVCSGVGAFHLESRISV